MKIHIDCNDFKLIDINRMLVSLVYDKRMPDSDVSWLLKKLKAERQRYLDSFFTFTDSNVASLMVVAEKLEEADKRMCDYCEMLLKREMDKKEHEQAYASRIDLEVEIGNMAGGPNDGVVEEEDDLWSALIHDCRDLGHYSIYTDDPDFDFLDDCRRECVPRRVLEGEELLKDKFELIRTEYLFAWQDIMQISDFAMSADLYY